MLDRTGQAVGLKPKPDTVKNSKNGSRLQLSKLATLSCPSSATLTLFPNGTGRRADITEVMGEIGKLLDASITGVEMSARPAPVMDLSKIDFEALRSRFNESKHKNTDLEVLKAAIRTQLEKLIRLNRTRADFAEELEELIESYNAGSRNIEELFEELLKLSRRPERRTAAPCQGEHERGRVGHLRHFNTSRARLERAEVKKVARDLLNRLKALLVLNWRQKSGARARVRLAIEDVLDSGLPRAYDKPFYERKCSALFEHVYVPA